MYFNYRDCRWGKCRADSGDSAVSEFWQVFRWLRLAVHKSVNISWCLFWVVLLGVRSSGLVKAMPVFQGKPLWWHTWWEPRRVHSVTSPFGFNKLSVTVQGCKPHSSRHLSTLALNTWKNSSTILQQSLYRFSQQIYWGVTCISCQARKPSWRTTPAHPLSVSPDNCSTERIESR